ncbi:MAG: Flp pilus assembly complex ATPase component TadA [Phycisphaerae bacterium]|nr:Flp pilus assembly complex ATPase component TadA [Phycisphaerae bacterium]
MLDQLLGAVEYGGYISILKLIGYLTLFFAWLPLIGWVQQDAKVLETKEGLWTGLILGVGAAAAVIWLVIPLYIGGMLFYLVAVGAVALAYVKHRNGRVLDYDRVLTIDHIKSLLVSKEKKMEALKSFTFVTANRNEIPVPEPRTADFFGFKTSYDIISDAIWRRASNVAFSPTAEDYKVAYFVDGASLKQPSIAREQMGYFTAFVKDLAGLDPKERRKPQKGRFVIRQGKDDMPWEVTTAGSTAGEQIRLKHIEQETISKIDEIGLMPEQHKQLSQLHDVKQGLCIISGPPKSGVTTTLYALLRNHDAFINSVNTLERQPSGEMPNITQNVYALTDTGTTTFGAKLQAVVRMGPDIVGVAECEDAETARVACAAAKDGKLVYVTLKADSVLQALGKWMRLVGDRNLVAETLLCASNQRLLRKLCEECKQGYAPDKELFKKFNITADKTKVLYRAGKVQYDKHGKPMTCDHCQGTGYFDRTGIFELVVMNDALRQAVRKSKSLPEIGAQFRRAKVLYLQEQVLRRVIAGTASINEMIRVLSTYRTKKTKPAQ